MKFYCTYGCSLSDNAIVCDGASKTQVEATMFQWAIEEYQSYEGCSLPSWNDVAEENELNIEDTEDYNEINSLYEDVIANDIHCTVVPFDKNNEEHLFTLKQQEGEFWVI